MKTSKKALISLFLIIVLLLTGCGQSAPEPGIHRSPAKVTPTPRPTRKPTPTPTPVPTYTPTPSPAPTATPTPVLPDVSDIIDASTYGYTVNEVLDYYCEVGLTSEFTTLTEYSVRKWATPLSVYVTGYPEDADLELMDRLFEALNKVNGFPGISFCYSEEESNVILRILPYDEYQVYALPAVNNTASDGYSTIWFRSGVIERAEIGIQSDLTRNNKNHVILEEIVQSLGLQNDSYMYDDSLFYQNYNEPQWPSDLDWLLVRFLYSPLVQVRMSEDDVRAIGEQIIK